MARNTPRPLTDDEIEALREEMAAQRPAIRAALEEAGVDTSGWGDGTDADDE